MDDRTKDIVEQKKQRELLYNERVIDHPVYGAIRLRRPTEEESGLIAEIRNKRYLEDLFDDSIKSRDEIAQRAVARGMWAPGMEERITTLVQQVGLIMHQLDQAGFKDLPEVIRAYGETVDKLNKEFEEPDEALRTALDNYVSLTVDPSHADRTKIMDEATSTVTDDLLEELDDLRKQIKMLNDFGTLRKEMETLQQKQAELFMGSLEARADREERLATMYYCCKLADTDKPVWESIEAMKRDRPEDVEYVLTQWQYYANGIDPDLEQSLEKYGFSRRLVATDDSSDDSPDQPQSNSAGESVEETPSTSSEAMASETESSTPSSSTSSTGLTPTME